MQTIDLKTIKSKLYNQIKAVEFAQLPISDYNKNYIQRLLPALSYYLEIYCQCIRYGLSKTDKKAEDLILVDFGGGSGFLSMLAKESGIGKVIYIDLNEKSVETVKCLSNVIGTRPDYILHGDAAKLGEWCKENNIKPNLLLSTDVIEHIYDLSVFFKELMVINNQMQMIFTTASSPYNPYVKRRLRRLMQGCEIGVLEQPNYFQKRADFIRKSFPTLTNEEVNEWTALTRGLVYDDIQKAISQNTRPKITDKYNTCDPETGNWAERILPIKEYRNLMRVYDFKVEVKKGFYNVKRNSKWKSLLFTSANTCIRCSGKGGLIISPFIFLLFSHK